MSRSSAAPSGRSGVQSRDQLLDVAEQLMSEKGYAGTPVSAICKAAGVAPTSLYWHFGSKEGLLASVMERGAARWFAALPRWSELTGDHQQRAATVQRLGAAAVGEHPLFLRLFYLLALEAGADEVAGDFVRRVRERAKNYFSEGIAGLLGDLAAPEIACDAAVELARFAVAFSDGCFFASQLEPDEVDLHQMYSDLLTALLALAPAALDRARKAKTVSAQESR
ncbi:TetR/AcrR family transcriptional regulator [Nocardia sp. NPDC023852]|uniref:TetR/AcrR family transcriptional regulator n=1 Tax=Nocardia sp. NPDC023852 TaxID=3154697 RepID=UPI0033EA9FE3